VLFPFILFTLDIIGWEGRLVREGIENEFQNQSEMADREKEGNTESGNVSSSVDGVKTAANGAPEFSRIRENVYLSGEEDRYKIGS